MEIITVVDIMSSYCVASTAMIVPIAKKAPTEYDDFRRFDSDDIKIFTSSLYVFLYGSRSAEKFQPEGSCR